MTIVEALDTTIIVAIEQLGYYGIFFGMILDGFGFPIPGTVIMHFPGTSPGLGNYIS